MDFIEVLKAVLLGFVEGLTEWLPISSTGHMILVDEFIKLKVSEEFMELFLVVIQLGAILAVVVLYFPKLWPFQTVKTKKNIQENKNLKENTVQHNNKAYKSSILKMDTIWMWIKVIIGIIPLGIVGVLFEDAIDEVFYNYQTVAVTLILYGVFFIILEHYNKKRVPSISTIDELSLSTAFFIGLFQVLSVIPGTSRSGATILGAMLLGVSRPLAAEFSFFLAVPVMFGASLLKVIKFEGEVAGSEIGLLIIGMAVAFIVSVIAIKFLMGYIKKKDFTAFGWYRIVLGVLVLVYFMAGI